MAALCLITFARISDEWYKYAKYTNENLIPGWHETKTGDWNGDGRHFFFVLGKPLALVLERKESRQHRMVVLQRTFPWNGRLLEQLILEQCFEV